ncbi:neurogenic locus notch homolog protein 1-like [Cyprinus carpio]|uniref:Neurogenic locus notch homolog protein 1-like n=1 Tax=Cyprinus carpio TaxID=7962 RepID=A0A9R0BCU1_CYPCA|nr:neurogenic locus notch homolog protein 1-like [Cyprinus carpio]
MHLTVRFSFIVWTLCRLSHAFPSDPYSSCRAGKTCQAKFGNGVCDQECSSSDCLRDGFDCLKDKGICILGHIQYCRNHYDNGHCDQGCNTAPCGWDGSDCHKKQYPVWAKGSLILHTRIPFQRGQIQNSSLLWPLSTVLQTSVKLRGMAPLHPTTDLLTVDTHQLTELYTQTPSYDSNGSVLFLQLDNRPCSRLPSTCFQYAIEAAHFLNAILAQNHASFPMIQEIQAAVISVRGVDEEIGAREEVKLPKEERNVHEASPAWMWPAVAVATGLGVAAAVIITVVFLWLKTRRQRREGGERVRHRSTVTDSNNGSKAWTRHSEEKRSRSGRDKDRNGTKKNKKGKESGKRRKEPLGEDAIRIRPLRKELDIGSDTDVTQSSMEDINRTICDHRSPDQKQFNHHQPRMLAPPRGWERNAVPTPQRAPRNSAPVQWCGPDGSVVLIRAVRSGLDRVVLELLRAGVPVNNTDHTGRSALHWACSVNHLPLARTLIRYGAAVDLQDHKGETALFLSALHDCYDTARFLLLNGANQDLTDCKGRRPLDVAQEGLHHQVLELLLAHRAPVPLDPATEVLWDDRTYVCSPWVASPPCLPGRSASFSGVIGHRGMSTPPPTDWQMGRTQCSSPQNWHSVPNQSAMALVSPRILGRPSRPISTLQEVTSEAEDEEREMIQDITRAAMPRFLSPQPAPRQRSFSCTQHALNRRYSGNHPELSVAVPVEKIANEHVEIVIVPHPREAASQSESKTSGNGPSAAQMDSERENIRNCNSKISERVSNEPAVPIQSSM